MIKMEFMDKYKEVMKKNLVSIIKFGTEGEPNNLLIISKKLQFEDLEIIKPVILQYRKKMKSVPILFTLSGLRDGADVFPLEILDMKYPHEVLYGEDILEDIKLDKKHVRRELEYELRSKLIHLRENYVGIKPRELKLLLNAAVPTLMPMFYGLLFLKDIKPPTKLDSLYREVHKAYKVDMTLFKEIREKKIEDLSQGVRSLILLLERLISIVDKLKV